MEWSKRLYPLNGLCSRQRHIDELISAVEGQEHESAQWGPVLRLQWDRKSFDRFSEALKAEKSRKNHYSFKNKAWPLLIFGAMFYIRIEKYFQLFDRRATQWFSKGVSEKLLRRKMTFFNKTVCGVTWYGCYWDWFFLCSHCRRSLVPWMPGKSYRSEWAAHEGPSSPCEKQPSGCIPFDADLFKRCTDNLFCKCRVSLLASYWRGPGLRLKMGEASRI